MSNEIKSKCICYGLLIVTEYFFFSSYKLDYAGAIIIGFSNIVLFMFCFLPKQNEDNNINVIETVHNPFIFIEMADIENNNECTICLSNDPDHDWVQISCNHMFHRNCIAEWLSINNTCPICREEHINR